MVIWCIVAFFRSVRNISPAHTSVSFGNQVAISPGVQNLQSSSLTEIGIISKIWDFEGPLAKAKCVREEKKNISKQFPPGKGF